MYYGKITEWGRRLAPLFTLRLLYFSGISEQSAVSRIWTLRVLRSGRVFRNNLLRVAGQTTFTFFREFVSMSFATSWLTPHKWCVVASECVGFVDVWKSAQSPLNILRYLPNAPANAKTPNYNIQNATIPIPTPE